MNTAFDVLEAARSHLSDELGLNWPDNRLFPKLQEAFRELQASLLMNGVPEQSNTSLVITVPALTAGTQRIDSNADPQDETFEFTTDDTSLYVTPNQNLDYPTDLVEPIDLYERNVGQRDEDFVEMVPVEFIPFSSLDNMIRYWSWKGDSLEIAGATVSKEIKMHYRRQLRVPQINADTIGVTLGETFLSHRVAALAMRSSTIMTMPKMAPYFDSVADKYLRKIITIAVKDMQRIGYKRIPYHRRRRHFEY